MKTSLFIAALALGMGSGMAQTLSEIIVKTDNENYDAAAKDFKALLARDPNKGDYYFYYGENFFKRGETDSANMMYAKGAEVNATNPLNYVGLGKVLLAKSNVDGAKPQFYKAVSLSASKSAEVFRRLAEAWLVTDIKNPDEAISYANSAIKLDPKNPENYILLGDAQLEKNPTDGSTPIKSYKMATTLNPKSTKGILREGKLYKRGRNYQLALDKYKEAEAIDASYAPAYSEKAELYYLVGQSAKSIENWKKYLELNNSDYARSRFMSALFKNKQYAEAVTEFENLKKSNFSTLYLERIAAYSYEEMGDKTDKEAYQKGLTAMNRFYEMAGKDFKFIADDYKYKGLLLYRTGKDSLGAMEVDKAIALNPAFRGEIYGKLAKMAVDAKNNDKAIVFYEKKRDGDFKNLNVTDCFDLGKAYYNTASTKDRLLAVMKDELVKKKKPADSPEIKAKEAENKEIFAKADTAFKYVNKLNPSYIMGYVWRGRVNSALDPKAERDSTKAYYEKAVSLMKPEEKTGSYKNQVIEAYEYLGFYYVTRKDKTNADAMFTMIKDLDPNNEKQKNYFAPPKTTKPAPTGKPKGK